ncbi:MAG: hypothetical protein IZT56_08460, partial [Bacteroidetes bacterium]|nr:hypothetical protein [Bacteroidota bacterium]
MKQIGMDKKIEKKKWSQKRLYYIAGAALFILLSFFGLKTLNKKVYKVDGTKISVKTVIEGDFQDMILIDGDIEPINLVLVNT